MILKKASYKAIKYACLNFHYAKRVPAQPMSGYSVFNSEGEWCGVIVFNIGVGSPNKPYKLPNGSVCELVRVALNGKQGITSKCVSIAVRQFAKRNPLCRMIVSYADSDQNHYGTIYQAMNWYYVSSHHTADKYIDPKTGKDVHSRSHSSTGLNKQFGEVKKVLKTTDLIRIKTGVKHKYLYPLSKETKQICSELRKPYPKNAAEVLKVARQVPNLQEGFDSTPSL
jgi:hypothetical protein